MYPKIKLLYTSILIISFLFTTIGCTKVVSTVAQMAGLSEKEAAHLQSLFGKVQQGAVYYNKCTKKTSDEKKCSNITLIATMCLGDDKEYKPEIKNIICDYYTELVSSGAPLTMQEMGDQLAHRIEKKGHDSGAIREGFKMFGDYADLSFSSSEYSKRCKKNGFSVNECKLDHFVIYGCLTNRVDKEFASKSAAVCDRVKKSVKVGEPLSEKDIALLTSLIEKNTRKSASQH